MWIRSQDKARLIECNNFFVAYDNGMYIIKTFVKEYNYFILGFYSTKEKALKVLDMIQEHINTGGKLFVIDQAKTDMGYTATYEKVLGVFQMPQDDEV